MGKIRIEFSHPLSSIIDAEYFEIDMDEPIPIRVLEQKIAERFPTLKKATHNFSYIFYSMEGKMVIDKNIFIKDGQVIKMLQPLCGG